MINNIISTLDGYLHKNDYDSAKAYLLNLQKTADMQTRVFISNELMGLYRKLGERENALNAVSTALELIQKLGIADKVGAATTYLNSATVYKAFGLSCKSIPLFEKAKTIYQRELDSGDTRLGGLYNNMALALVDEKRFDEADALYNKALSVMVNNPPELAITYLNMASAVEARYGLADGDAEIQKLLEKAEKMLESHKTRDGNYAFVCEKCASVFGYYGHFAYQKELENRARRIYEGA